MPVDTLLDARSLADLSPIALLVIDDRRRIVDGNPAAEVLFQISRRSLTGKPLSELIYHDSLIWELLDRAQRQVGDIASPGTPVTGPSIHSRLVCDVWIRTTGDEGFVIALVESSAREGHESAAGVAGFGRILGHEVKNPLGGIIGVLGGVAVGLLLKVLGLPILFSATVAAAAFLCAAVIGLVFGFAPALKAARLNPVEALSNE